MADHPADGRARCIEALLDYVLEHDAEMRRLFEEKAGISYETLKEMLRGEPIFYVEWKH